MASNYSKMMYDDYENLIIQNGELKQENKALKSKIKSLENDIKKLEKKLNKSDEKVNKQIEEAVKKVTEELVNRYEKEIEKRDQRIFELTARLNVNSSTSSLPSSKDPIDYQPQICNSREKSDKKKGGQPKHKKHNLRQFDEDEITSKVEHNVDICPYCGNKDKIILNFKIRDELNIRVEVDKIRHIFPTYKCLNCGKTYSESIPASLHAENQYGNGVQALALSLLDFGFVSYNRTRKMICGLTNNEVNPSEGYLIKMQKRNANKLDTFLFDVKEKMLESTILHWDDTVIRIEDNDKACLRVYTNRKYVLYKAHMKKDTDGMDDDGILQNLPSTCTVMHDHLLHNYSKDYSYQNIECNAHIARKLKGITVNTSHKWSEKMKNLLESTLNKRKEYIKAQKNKFPDDLIADFYKQYDEIIEYGIEEHNEFKHKYEFTREDNLLEFMRDYKKPITDWVQNFQLPYSNNLAETLLRMIKSKMKISYRFNSVEQAENFAKIVSYTETCGRFGINKYSALQRLCNDNPYTVAELESIQEELDKKKKQSTQ